MLDHFRRDVGMQVEAHDQRYILADDTAHTCQQLAFAVVEMFSDHRPVKIEIDAIEVARGGDAVEHHLGDALIGVARHMRRWRCGRENGRH